MLSEIVFPLPNVPTNKIHILMKSLVGSGTDILPAEVVILPGANLIGNAHTKLGTKLLPATQGRR